MRMKRWMSFLLCLVLCGALLAVTAASAHADGGQCGDNLTWSFDSNTGILTIIGSGDMTSTPWSSVSAQITGISLPQGLTSIRQRAFQNCTGLRSAVIPDTVTSIGDYAFSGCTGLASLTIGSGIVTIGRNAFSACTGLVSLTIPNSVTTIEYRAFFNCKGLTSVSFGNGLTSIGDQAFYNCTGLTSLTIPDNVTSIGGGNYSGAGAFHGCTGLTSVTFGNAVTAIGNYAFCDCTALTSITLPVSVSSIGAYAFKNCGMLVDVYYKGTAEDKERINIGSGNDCLLNADWYFPGDEHRLQINEANFPDPVFRSWIIDNLDVSVNNRGKYYMTDSKVAAVTEIVLSDDLLRSLKGVEYFTKLKTLICEQSALTALDVSKNTELTTLNCYENGITALDLSKNTKLEHLDCGVNCLTTLDLSKNTALQDVSCADNYLKTLDVSKNTALKELCCTDNLLTALDLSNNTELENLSCGENRLTSLGVSKNVKLKGLSCEGSGLTSLDVSRNTALEILSCEENQLAALDVSRNTALEYLTCDQNNLTSLDVTRNTALETLSCEHNKLTSLNVSNNPQLTYFSCCANRLTALDVSRNTKLSSLDCSENSLTRLHVAQNTDLDTLYCSSNRLPYLDLSNNAYLSDLHADAQRIPGKRLVASGGKYTYALSELVPNTRRVTVTTNGASYNDATGVVTFSSPVKSFSYLYATECGDMSVTVELAERVQVRFVSDPSFKECTIDVYDRDVDLEGPDDYDDYLIAPDPDGDYRLVPGTYTYVAYITYEDGEETIRQRRFTVPEGTGGEPFVVTVGCAPWITAHPKDVTVNAGDKATFTVKAAGATSYQWFGRSSTNGSWITLDGARGASYTVVGTPANNGWQYCCGAHNEDGVVYSNVATLTVKLVPPTITAHPKDVTVKIGQQATFSVKVSGYGTITYQWFSRPDANGAWSIVSGATASGYTVVGTQANNGWQFRCRVKNEVGEVYSNAAALTVSMELPTIKTQPKDAKVKSGSKAKFSVKAKEKDVTYQWFCRASAYGEWRAIPGETKNKLTVVGTGANRGWQYRCQVQKRGGGAIYSNTVTLYVTLQPPVIKTQPKNLAVVSGKKAKFSVKASGKNITYQWFTRADAKSAWKPVPGSNKNTLNVVASKANNGSQYYCYLKNADGEVDSAVVTLTVTPQPPTIKTQPKDAKVKLGGKAKFKVKASGKNVTYQWYYRTSETGEWILLEGATKDKYEVKVTAEMIGWQFRCLAKNADGQAYSKVATLLKK